MSRVWGAHAARVLVSAARRNELFCRLMMDWETTAFFLRSLEFIKTWISPKMMRASR